MRPQRSPLPEGAETWVTCSHSGASQACLNEVRSPKERRRRGIVWSIRMIESASTKSAPRRSGDIRAPTIEGDCVASTKSAPRRSGDLSLHRLEHLHRASTKSAPRRSGDTRRCRGSGGRCSLNEVRSPKERRPPPRMTAASAHTRPQRSPLPEGAETSTGATRAPTAPRLNEVRSPKERRRCSATVQSIRCLASTKSAPRRSGDGLPRRSRRLHRRASTKSAPRRSGDWMVRPSALSTTLTPQRSPLPEGAETVETGRYPGYEGASTKSAPRRSGDPGAPVGRYPGAPASTKSAPRRSGDRPGRRLVIDAHDASTKSAPRRSGDKVAPGEASDPDSPQRSPLPEGAETRRSILRRWTRVCLNEVRSPKERRPIAMPPFGNTLRQPQRSPLPEGAETACPCTPSATLSGLNEVRSPKERRPAAACRAAILE